jgi:hypothetical protein
MGRLSRAALCVFGPERSEESQKPSESSQVFDLRRESLDFDSDVSNRIPIEFAKMINFLSVIIKRKILVCARAENDLPQKKIQQ